MASSNAVPDGSSSQPTNAPDDNNQAVELIRAKIGQLYVAEPDAKVEAAEAEAARPRSKHQQFMHELTASGKSLAEIQTAWHTYYQSLPNDEKHAVWQEFYAGQKRSHTTLNPNDSAANHTTPPAAASAPTHHQSKKSAPARPASISELKEQLLHSVSKRVKVTHKHRHQLKSLGFGLSMGALVMLILLFGFFNERFIAPFITPSRTISATPIISELTETETVPPNPVIIVPKINIEIPVVYDEPSIDEAAVQRALERGVLHYPTTSNPGEQGNAVFFGHSSSNIFNNGKYKFAFVLLNRLENGDTFMIQKEGKRYVYRVFEKKIVPPTELSVLNDRDRPTATLITCDPPGTAVNRLVVTAEQISPDPAVNVASSAKKGDVAAPRALPSEAPSLWSRFWGWVST